MGSWDVMENTFNKKIIEACFYSCDNVITEVNKAFINFTGFNIDELLGKSLCEIGDMLKINSQILLDNIICKYSGYIFTKSLSSREVSISLSNNIETNEKVYNLLREQIQDLMTS